MRWIEIRGSSAEATVQAKSPVFPVLVCVGTGHTRPQLLFRLTRRWNPNAGHSCYSDAGKKDNQEFLAQHGGSRPMQMGIEEEPP